MKKKSMKKPTGNDPDFYKNEYEKNQKVEKLIVTLSEDFFSVDTKNIEKTMHRWMIKIAKTLDADKSVIFFKNTNNNFFISDFWRKENIVKPTFYTLVETFPYLASLILKGNIITVSSIDELPNEAKVDKINLKKFGTESFLLFPLGESEHILGAFLFAYMAPHDFRNKNFIDRITTIVHIFSALLRREYDLEKMKERIEYESLLSHLSKDFVTIKADEIDNRITYWLHKSAESFEVEKALLYMLNDEDKFYLTNTWRSSENQPVAPYDPEKQFPWISNQLRANKKVIITNLTVFPEEAQIDKSNIPPGKTISALALPLFTEDKIVGALAYCSTKSTFNLNGDLIQRLETISQVFATALLRQRTSRNLQEEKERLAVTLKSIGDGVITTDILGNITLLNNVAEEITGWSQNEVRGVPLSLIFKIIDERTGEPLYSPVAKVLETSGIVTLSNHTVLIDRKGDRKIISDSSAPIKDSGGHILGVVLVFRDITLESKREADILKLKQLENIGVLAGGIAHDFNNILTGIMGNINLAAMSGENGSEEHDYLMKSLKGCERAAALTHKLLTFSRGGAPVKENASIDEIVTESIDFVLHGSNIQTETFIQDGLWAAEVDRNQISQVIQNLILNSVEAMPDGGIISLSCKNRILGEKFAKQGNYIQITIKDTGKGITKENLDKIFDPYFSTKSSNSGLGLAITHSIINKHEGFIEVTSEHGKGTEVSLFLPATSHYSVLPNNTKEQEPLQTTRKYSILAMDDEQPIRTLLEAMLGSLGHTVTSVKNGEEAVTVYQHNNFDLVILDITIPGGMGGIETIQMLKNIDPEVKALVSSGYANSPILSDFESYGFLAALAKPYLLQELEAAVNTVMQK